MENIDENEGDDPDSDSKGNQMDLLAGDSISPPSSAGLIVSEEKFSENNSSQ